MRRTPEEVSEMLEDGSVPARYRDCRFDNFVTHNENVIEKLEQIKQFAIAKCPTHGLFLWGPPGTGKTHLALAVMSEFLARGANGIFLSAIEYVFQVQNAYGNPSGIVSDLAELNHFILIDDFGAETLTDSARQAMFYLVDQFYSQRKRLILTSNIAPKDLYREDSRTMSRLFEICTFVELKEADYRVRKAQVLQDAERLGPIPMS
jgi:DNA replication protein DnaC